MAETAVVEQTAPVVPVETPKVEVPAETKPDEKAKFSELVKKERMIFHRNQQVASKAKEVEAKEKAVSDREAKLAAAQSNPVEALKLLGWTYDQITQYIVNNQQTPPDKHVADIRNELSDFKKQAAEEKRLAAEAAQAQAQAQTQEVIENFKQNLNEYIDTNKDKYELVSLHEAQAVVYETIEQHYEKTKKVMTMEEASDLVEKYLEDQIDRSTKTKKLASKYQPPPPTEEKKVEKTEPRTLTNAMNSGSSPGMLPAKNESDRLQRALAALDGKR